MQKIFIVHVSLPFISIWSSVFTITCTRGGAYCMGWNEGQNITSYFIVNLLKIILYRGHLLRLTVSSTGHICNEDIFARFKETNFVQWICTWVTLTWPNLCITNSYEDREEHSYPTWCSHYKERKHSHPWGIKLIQNIFKKSSKTQCMKFVTRW